MKTNAGIYQIRNLATGDLYIGSTGIGFSARWAVHKRQLMSGQHHSIILQRAWNKYGSDSFAFEILLFCDPEDCLLFEQMALDTIQPCYNVSLVAASPMLGRRHSDQSKQRISRSLSGNQYAAGRKYTQKQKHEMSIATRGINTGESNGNAKLNDIEVVEIKRLLANGLKQIEIARRFDVTASTISAIKKGKRRKTR